MFDKNYPNRKDHRRRYYGAQAVDHTCRPHGSCVHCAEGRKHNERKRVPADLREQLAEVNVNPYARVEYFDYLPVD